MTFPELSGAPIEVSFLARPMNHRGKLRSGGVRGFEIHGASLIRERRIVLDAALRQNRTELERILVHELFHFVWLRLGNPKRRSWEALLAGKRQGELGWSAESGLMRLRRGDRAGRTRRWREYGCEAFCDTAAWLFTGGRHPEYTLGAAERAKRRAWFAEMGLTRRISV
jgi:hypothetical protein